MLTHAFTQAELRGRHSVIATAGLCPDCEVKLVLPQEMSWPHEDCPSCGAHYLADYHPGYRRMIQAFPIAGEIRREMLVSVLDDRQEG